MTMSFFQRLNGILKKKTAMRRPSPVLPKNALTDSGSEPSAAIGDRLSWFQLRLVHSSDVVFHEFVAGPQIKCALLYIKGMVDRHTLQKVLKELVSLDKTMDSVSFSSLIFERSQLPLDDTSIFRSVPEALTAILSGQALLLVDRDENMLALSVTSFDKRAIEEAPNEIVIRGPREAFIEDYEDNLTLIRRKLKTANFKSETMQIGTESKTTIAIAYMQGICKQELIDEVRKRLSDIEIDGVWSTNYIEEFIEDNPYSPFPQIQYTERPDVVAASLLEGRVAVIVDGAPNVLLAPVTFFMLMQSAEDYYDRFIPATGIRWVRFTFLFVSLLLPSIYIALTTIHPEIIPDKLLKTIAASREIVPFPALVEAFIMEILFEALREASIRIPKSMGQAVSIIGALIIGTAAVEAGIVSSVMVIIVSLTGISSFIIPHFDLGLSFRLLRFPIMFLAGTFGLFGIACGLILIYLHMVELRSFGTPYLSPLAPLRFGELKDVLFRAPLWSMKSRPGNGPNRRRVPAATRKWAQVKNEEGD